jgi:hypothetical protein
MSSENRYILEGEGISLIQASECKAGAKTQTPVEIMVGNRPNAILMRGTFKVDELTFKHATSLGTAGAELAQWLDDYCDGVDVSKRGFRLVLMSEDGITPVESHELLNCVPTKYELENHSASGTGASMFTFGLRPENKFRI